MQLMMIVPNLVRSFSAFAFGGQRKPYTMNTNVAPELAKRNLSEYRSSLSRIGSLSVPLTPQQIYGYNSSVGFGIEITEKQKETIKTGLAKFIAQTPEAQFQDRLVSKLELKMAILTEEEKADFTEIAALVRKYGAPGQRAFERALCEDGFGQPAIALQGLVVAVVVAVAVAIIVWIVAETPAY